MSLFRKLLKRPRIVQYLLFFMTTIAVVVCLAGTQSKQSDRILIDGKNEPERVPDWIVWDVFFQQAVHLNETSSTHGQELWIDRLHLSQEVMDAIVAQGYEYVEMADDKAIEVENLVTDSKKAHPQKIDHPDRKEGLRIKAKKVQLHMESRTLEMRDRLRQRIGEDAFLRLSSFVRLQIARQIVIGS
jgi:hypothetical protein